MNSKSARPKPGNRAVARATRKYAWSLLSKTVTARPAGGYARVIDDYSAASLKPIFDDHISKDATIKADGWTGYAPIKQDYKGLRQVLSDKGKNSRCCIYRSVTSRTGSEGCIHTATRNTSSDTLTSISSGSTEGITGERYSTKLSNGA